MSRSLEEHPLRLTWQHTWPEGGADFTARPDDGFARVYKRPGVNDPGKEWFWTAANWRSLGTGLAATKREACDAAESARLALPTATEARAER